MADHMKNELKSGNHSNRFYIKAILSMKLPTVMLAILKSLTRNPSLSLEKSSHVSYVPNSSMTTPSTPTLANEPNAISNRLLAQELTHILLEFDRSERTSPSLLLREIFALNLK